MASGESFINSSMRSLSPSKLVNPGQCSSVIWLNKPICCCVQEKSKHHVMDLQTIYMWMRKRHNGTYSNNLPEKTEDQMGFAFAQIVSINVDDIAADRLSRVQS